MQTDKRKVVKTDEEEADPELMKALELSLQESKACTVLQVTYPRFSSIREFSN